MSSSIMRDSVNPAEINNFIRTVQAQGDYYARFIVSGTRSSRDFPRPGVNKGQAVTYHHHHHPPPPPPRRGSSITIQSIAPSTVPSSVQSTSHGSIGSGLTAITVPSSRSTVPPSVADDRIDNTTGNAIHPLPCELAVYGQCSASFALDNVELWIEHHLVHLHDSLPSACICWYCDDFRFEVDHHIDAMTNYRNRMYHIRNHIRDDYQTVHEIRPDFHFIHHFHDYGLIPNSTYHAALRWYDGVPYMAGIYNHDFMPREREVSDASQYRIRHGSERRNSRSRRTQLSYHS